MGAQPPGREARAARSPQTPQPDRAVGLVGGQGPPAAAQDTALRLRPARAGGSPAVPAPATPRQQRYGAFPQGAHRCASLAAVTWLAQADTPVAAQQHPCNLITRHCCKGVRVPRRYVTVLSER